MGQDRTAIDLPALREAVADIPLPLDGESLTSAELTKIQIQKLVRCVNAVPVLLDDLEAALTENAALKERIERKDSLMRQLAKDGRVWMDKVSVCNARLELVYGDAERDALRDDLAALRQALAIENTAAQRFASQLDAEKAAHETTRQAWDALQGDLAAARAELDRLRGRVRLEDHEAVLADLAAARAVLDNAVTTATSFGSPERVWIVVDRAAWLAWQEARKGLT